MKSFFDLFKVSYQQLTGRNCIRSISVTAVLIAVYTVIEGTLTIDIPFAKINFAYIAIAAIGMLFGPVFGFFGGCICDILGYLVHPTGGAFLPVYTLIAGFQGLIYGLVLFRVRDGKPDLSPPVPAIFCVKAAAARILDVLIINLICNTTANLHYGFIHADSLPAALKVRLIKNLLQLCADIPIVVILLPILFTAYRRVFRETVFESAE